MPTTALGLVRLAAQGHRHLWVVPRPGLRHPGPLGRPRPARAEGSLAPGRSTRAVLHYQGAGVPASTVSTGQVGTVRDALGSDSTFFGVDPVPTEVELQDGRGRAFTLNEHGFKLVEHPWRHIDYYQNDDILGVYYPECEALVCRETGASFALAFDHNIRARVKKQQGKSLIGGNAVQEPLVTYGVHNDYTVTSAPTRIRQLAEPPKHNDTMRQVCGSKPPIDPRRVERLLKGRWVFVNVWRNITEKPVVNSPLGLCDASSTSTNELVVFEIRYSDRVGENYFSKHHPGHHWYYFPGVVRDEAVLIKCWDSRGRDFVKCMPGQETSNSAAKTVPATFSLHTGFDDPAAPSDAPDRESIEVRLVAFFEDS